MTCVPVSLAPAVNVVGLWACADLSVLIAIWALTFVLTGIAFVVLTQALLALWAWLR